MPWSYSKKLFSPKHKYFCIIRKLNLFWSTLKKDPRFNFDFTRVSKFVKLLGKTQVTGNYSANYYCTFRISLSKNEFLLGFEKYISTEWYGVEKIFQLILRMNYM